MMKNIKEIDNSDFQVNIVGIDKYDNDKKLEIIELFQRWVRYKDSCNLIIDRNSSMIVGAYITE